MGPTPPKMESGPPQMIEKVVGVLLPPACREEVLGDLHERYAGRRPYLAEAVRTVPLVILSRIRRTTDPGLLLLEAMALYLSLVLGVRVFGDPAFLEQPQAYFRLAFPVLVALLALVLVDAYASRSRRLSLGPLAGFLALLLQSNFQAANPELALPSFRMILLSSLVGMLLVAALRLFFEPGDHHTTGAG